MFPTKELHWSKKIWLETQGVSFLRHYFIFIFPVVQINRGSTIFKCIPEACFNFGEIYFRKYLSDIFWFHQCSPYFSHMLTYSYAHQGPRHTEGSFLNIHPSLRQCSPKAFSTPSALSVGGPGENTAWHEVSQKLRQLRNWCSKNIVLSIRHWFFGMLFNQYSVRAHELLKCVCPINLIG